MVVRDLRRAGSRSWSARRPGSASRPRAARTSRSRRPRSGWSSPGCVTYEPAFAIEVEWTLLASLARLGRPDGTSAYLRLSTRPVDQHLAAVPADPAARERRRRQVVAGAYLLRCVAPPGAPGGHDRRAWARPCPRRWPPRTGSRTLGHAADVVCVTSPGLLFDAVQARGGRGPGESGTAESWILDAAFPARRAAPLVTLLDGHPHALAFLAGVNGMRATHLGVTRFGQSGDLESVYRHHGLDADSVVAAALDLL